MATRVDPNLDRTLSRFGLANNSLCFNCGLCTATCDLTRGREVFPRKAIRYAQLGLRKKLDESIEPWLCYYCGDCNERCPREARPSEQMMAFRRYLTSVYDWTGLLAKFYPSKRWAFGATAAIALAVIMLFVVGHALNPGRIPTALAVAPDGSTYVPLNTFAPVEWVHLFDWILAGTLLFLIFTTLYNMQRKMLGSDKTLHVPFWLYLRQLWVAPVHFLTQKRLTECGKLGSSVWGFHLLLMSGYIAMFALVVFFLPSLQIDKEGINWTAGPGYYATAALLIACGYFIVSRWRKRQAFFEQSHFTDWIFIGLLASTVLTGIASHIFRFYLQWPVATCVTYVLHLAVAVPIYVSPKWAHVVYRPAAMYFASVRRAAEEQAERVPVRVIARPQVA